MIFAPPVLPPEEPPAVVDVQRPTEILAENGETVASGPVTLTWAAPEGCPPAAEVMKAVQRYLAKEGDTGDAVVVRGQVEARGSMWRVDMALERKGSTSRRALEGGSCTLLTKGAALLVAVHVDAVGTSARVRKLETPISPEVLGKAPGEVTVIEAPPPEGEIGITEPPPPLPPRRRPPLTIGGHVRFVLTGGVGDLPRFPGGFALAGGVKLSRFRIEAQLDYAPPRPGNHPTNGFISGTFQSIAGTLRGCWVPGQGRFTFPLCAGIRASGLRGEGRRGVQVPNPAWVPWAGAALEPAIVFSPIPRVGIYGSIGALAAFARPAFAVGTETEPIFRVSTISALVTVGVEVNFGTSPGNKSARIRGSL